MMKWVCGACAMAGLVLSTGGCKTQKKEPTFVAPEPLLSSQEPAATYDVTPARTTVPEPPVTPTYSVYTPSVSGSGDESPTYDLTPPVGAVVPATGQTYVVQKGDTLYSLARRFYNDQRKWQVIYAANRSVLNDPNQIRVGQTLTIPPAN